MARRICIFSALFAMVALPAFAQGGARALVAPGEAVPAIVLDSEAGPVGRALAPLIGMRPVLVVYWRPGDALSEAALAGAADVAGDAAPDAVLFPVAVLARSQRSNDVVERLGALGLGHLPAHIESSGALATIIGVMRVPSFALIDVTGTLRLVGGSNITQANEEGISILEALILAGRAQPVPTLGVLAQQPVYRLLGRQLPGLALTRLDGSTWRKLTDYLEPNKKLLVFYWSPSCSHCKQALPALRAWYEKDRPQDIVVIDVARADVPALKNAVAPMIESYPWP
ncbi:MAG: redoxin domain-containing protein, partial [Acidobacteriota bacterium]